MLIESLWSRIALIAAAGACGALARWGTNSLVHTLLGPRDPWQYGTVAVNAIGCFAFGVIVVLLRPQSPAALALLTGFLGAYTTFSAFAFDTHHLYAAAGATAAAANVVLHVALGMAALVAGMALGRTVF